MIRVNFIKSTEACHARQCDRVVVFGRTRCVKHLLRMKENTRLAEIRGHERQAKGLCTECAEPIAPTSITFCQKHLDLATKRSKEQRDKRKAEGICHSCPLPARLGYSHCEKHSEKYRLATSRRLGLRKELGLCATEGCSDPPVQGRSKCEMHLAKQRDHEYAKRQGLTRLGLCYGCGKPTSDGLGRCDDCKALNQESLLALKAKRQADGACIYCGGPGERSERRLRTSCITCRKRRNEYSASIPNRFGRARRTAIRAGKEWTITLEEYSILAVQPCTYCELTFETYGTGLDRIRNQDGYHMINVLPCCPECNVVRNSMFTVEEMRLLGVVVRKIKLSRTVKFSPNGGTS